MHHKVGTHFVCQGALTGLDELPLQQPPLWGQGEEPMPVSQHGSQWEIYLLGIVQGRGFSHDVLLQSLVSHQPRCSILGGRWCGEAAGNVLNHVRGRSVRQRGRNGHLSLRWAKIVQSRGEAAQEHLGKSAFFGKQKLSGKLKTNLSVNLLILLSLYEG